MLEQIFTNLKQFFMAAEYTLPPTAFIVSMIITWYQTDRKNIFARAFLCFIISIGIYVVVLYLVPFFLFVYARAIEFQMFGA